MGIERRVTVYEGPGGPFEGMAVADPQAGTLPGILLIPNVLGTKGRGFRSGGAPGRAWLCGFRCRRLRPREAHDP